MWPFKRQAAKPVSRIQSQGPAVAMAPVSAVLEVVHHDAPEGYDALAKRLRVVNRPNGRTDQPLRRWLASEGIPVYSSGAVHKYLDGIFGKNTNASRCWIWRTATAPEHYENDRIVQQFNFAGAEIGGWYDRIDKAHRFSTYTKAIPYPVLLTMDRVLKVFNNARFYISDAITEEEKAAMLDPFLLVVVDSETYCVERWDEPGFKGLE